ncbi:putative traG protein [Rickettsia hoogstraalii str. RCCE3]|nr:putative traG protein [Rickettsia hoogstraalii str. RCCE3]
MTDYVIHTFGGGDILWQVFNGIGRVFASNSEYFTPVGQFALTIGGIWAATRAIFRGNIGILPWSGFFHPYLFLSFYLLQKQMYGLRMKYQCRLLLRSTISQ